MKPPTIEQLTVAFAKATTVGPENLEGTDRDYFLIQDFILEWEDGALAEFIYDCTPDLGLLTETIDSMKRHGLVELAAILSEAGAIFDGYEESSPPTVWKAVVKRYDPSGKLGKLDNRIRQIHNYGLLA